MTDTPQIPSDLSVFASLTPDEIRTMTAAVWHHDYPANTVIFREGDKAGALFIVTRGRVRVVVSFAAGLEKEMLNLGMGDIFGELSVITGQDRSATATTLEDTSVLSIDKMALGKLCREHPQIGNKLLRFLLLTVAERLHTTTTHYRNAVDWALNVSDAMELNLNALAGGRLAVAAELVTGSRVAGELVKVQKHGNDSELVIRNSTGEVVVIPYHAVASIAFPAEAVQPRKDRTGAFTL